MAEKWRPLNFLIVFDKTIIPLVLVGYEMITVNLALRASSAIYHLISNARSWNNCQICMQVMKLSCQKNVYCVDRQTVYFCSSWFSARIIARLVNKF